MSQNVAMDLDDTHFAIDATADTKNEHNVLISVNDYNAAMPSKGDEYVTALQMGYYLPPPIYCSRAYCRSVIFVEQKCPKLVDIKRTNLKKYDSASISNFFAQLKDHAEEITALQVWLPRKRNAKARPVKLHRGWLFDLANTYAPTAWKQFLDFVTEAQKAAKKEYAKKMSVPRAGVEALRHA